jgi:hypothetical protein
MIREWWVICRPLTIGKKGPTGSSINYAIRVLAEKRRLIGAVNSKPSRASTAAAELESSYNWKRIQTVGNQVAKYECVGAAVGSSLGYLRQPEDIGKWIKLVTYLRSCSANRQAY